MIHAVEYVGEVAENTSAMLLGRVLGWSGSAFTQAALSSITYKVTPVGKEATLSGTVTIASSIFNVLQTDDLWDKDAIGYNFRHTIPPTGFTQLGKTFIEYTFTATGGEVSKVVYEVTVIDTSN